MEEQEQYQVEENLQDWMVDQRIEELRENNQEIERLETIKNERIKQLEEQFKYQKDKIDKKNYYLQETIKQAVLSSEDKKEAKTQWKKTFLSGDAVIKKASVKPKKPNKDKFEEVFKVYPSFKKVKEAYDVNWKDLSKQLQVVDGKIFDVESGENVSHLFELDEKGEELVIKQ